MRQDLNRLKNAGASRAEIDMIYTTMQAGEKARRDARVKARAMVADLLDRYLPQKPADECPSCHGLGAATCGTHENCRECNGSGIARRMAA